MVCVSEIHVRLWSKLWEEPTFSVKISLHMFILGLIEVLMQFNEEMSELLHKQVYVQKEYLK